MRKCFACDKKLENNPPIIKTIDGQYVFVGRGCWHKIKKTGEIGYQPPLGGPRLWIVPIGPTQKELGDIRYKVELKY